MGTNYYVMCLVCGNKTHHVGKQNASHNFLSNWMKEQVQAFLAESPYLRIVDENEHELNWDDFVAEITKSTEAYARSTDWEKTHMEEMSWS